MVRASRLLTAPVAALVVPLVAGVLMGACGKPPAWPPPVQRVTATSPALAPADALRTFHLPPGYRLELVASEPQVQDPVAIDIDADGRVWVVEMRGYLAGTDAVAEQAPIGRIVVLEDVDDDGRADTSTVFLDGLVLPRAIKVLEDGVLIGAPPHVWLARDTDGDLKADTKVSLRDDFGVPGQNPEHSPNGLLWGLDNWIYTSEHNGHWRWRPAGLEHHPTLSRGQWGVSMDDEGRLFRNWNDDPLRVDYLPARYYARHPGLVRTRGLYEQVAPDLTVWPVRPTPGVNRGYREGVLRSDQSLAVFASAGTPVVYRGDRLPLELRGDVFVTEPAGNLVRRYVLRTAADGRLSARNPYERGEFLASTDERFRPVNLYSAPDGTLYVVDMYRGVIQHRQFQSEYLKDQIRSRQLDRPTGYGRIYRVVHEGTVREGRPALRAAPGDRLRALLAHPNGWWRDTAQRLLVERQDRGVVEALRRDASVAPDARTRLHALWTLEGLDALTPDLVRRALDDAAAPVRASAIRLAEPWLVAASSADADALQTAVWRRRDDEAPAVRWQLALSLGVIGAEERVPRLAALIDAHGTDPVVIDAVVSGLAGLELAAVERLLASASSGAGPSDAIAMLAGAAARRGDEVAVQAMLRRVADRALAVDIRLAIMRGIDLALGGLENGDDRRPSLRFALTKRPEALLARAPEGGAIDAAIARTLSRLEWTGKVRTEPIVAPLTAAEQARFDAGREVYGGLCAPCHQPDGRGRDGVAPALAGSRWVGGRAGLLARIVLNGKEDRTVMPPLGSLTDEQMAAVLTYVRRAFGNTASAVEVTLVREARGASTGRVRPWTEKELLAVTQPDGPPRATP